MSSMREQALSALSDRLSASLLGTVRRADGTAADVPSTGALVTQEDGSLDAEPIMSPLCYAITHTVPITVQTGTATRTAMDGALQGIAGVIADDPTLGGAVEWAEISGIDVDTDAPSEKGQILSRERVAELTVTLTYTAPTPVG